LAKSGRDLSRRDFLKIAGGTAAASAVVGTGPDSAEARERENRMKGAAATTTICPYCAVGCGMIVYTKAGKIVNIEGDPEHPINEGTLCSKGASLIQVADNPLRVTQPRYRAPGASEWKDVTWEWALNEIAQRVKRTRDAAFQEKNGKGQTVNRCEAIAHVGSAALDNEECYILQKWLRSLGLVYIEHQARI
jgi:formate dehydrogenase major subunit